MTPVNALVEVCFKFSFFSLFNVLVVSTTWYNPCTLHRIFSPITTPWCDSFLAEHQLRQRNDTTFGICGGYQLR